MNNLELGIINQYSSELNRLCDVLQVPNGYLIKNVNLPYVMGFNIKPREGSLVLMCRVNDFGYYIISVLKECNDDLSEGVRGNKDSQDFEKGEVFLQAILNHPETQSKQGGSIYLDAMGDIELCSPSGKERIVVGGNSDFSEEKVIIQGSNIDIETNPNPTSANLASSLTFKVDELTGLGPTLKLENQLIVPFFPEMIKTHLAGLTITPENKLTLDTTLLGVPNCKLEFDVAGKITLENQFSTVLLSSTGEITIKNSIATITVSSDGSVSITGGNISLGSSVKKLVTEEFKDIFNDHVHVYSVQGVPAFTNKPTDMQLPSIPAAPLPLELTTLHLTSQTKAG